MAMIRSGHFTALMGIGAVLVWVFAGCGKSDGVPRVRVSGVVSFQGQPVADGQIRFVPKPGNAVPLTIVTISDGRYDTASIGGVPVGQHRVEIQSFDPKTPAPKLPGDPQRKQLLPAKYNSASTLELEVKSGQASLKQDYNLTP
jgi:hypothetical protein